jgi:hypothetical protein
MLLLSQKIRMLVDANKNFSAVKLANVAITSTAVLSSSATLKLPPNDLRSNSLLPLESLSTTTSPRTSSLIATLPLTSLAPTALLKKSLHLMMNMLL